MTWWAQTSKVAAVVSLSLAVLFAAPVQARDLGIEGQIFEPIEEDFRLILMRLIARTDWTESTQELEESAKSYTKNLPAYMLPRAETTQTRWKDVGIVVTEDIYMPWVDSKTGSVFEPEQVLAVQAGTYMNPIAKLPSAGIERLFIFDATDPDQLTLARKLMAENIPQMSFMLIAGDPGPLSEEMHRPMYHPTPTMLEKFNVRAVPSLVGFGRGPHLGHMAVTEFSTSASVETVKLAWFGLPYAGYDPENLPEVSAENLPGEAGGKNFMSAQPDLKELLEKAATMPKPKPKPEFDPPARE